MIFNDRDISFVISMVLVGTFCGFAVWINKRLKMVEDLVKSSDRYHTPVNIPYFRLLLGVVASMLTLDYVTEYLGIETAGIPMIVIIGITLTGMMVGYFPRMPRDNEFRGKR